MKFWELSSVFSEHEEVLAEALKGSELCVWLRDISDLVDRQDRAKLDYIVPDIICKRALKQHPGVLYLGSDNHLRSYRINKSEWAKAGNPVIAEQAITFWDVMKKYGGGAIEETLEYGSLYLGSK